MTAHAILTPEQVARYFDRLGLAKELRRYSVAGLNACETLDYLALLQKLHLATIPFENLNLHYSAHGTVSVHPDQLFNKIVGDNKGRGGYCMENNCLFGMLLKSLGFTQYPGGGRVYEPTGWAGWGHLMNFVIIGDTKYQVDVGFGGDGPTVPMPLDRTGAAQQQIKPAQTRLQWRNIPGNTDPGQRLWVYEYRRNDESEWDIKYCFTEVEFLPNDYISMNYFSSTSPRTFFTSVIIVDKKIMDDNGELVGKMSMSGAKLRWHMGGEKTKEIEFKSEAERIEALEQYFGIRLDQVERDGIAGLPSEIK